MELNGYENPQHDQIHIVINKIDLMSLTAKQCETYLNEVIAKALREIVATKHADIEREVDKFIFSSDTRHAIEQLVIQKVNEALNQFIKDLFPRR